MLCYLVTSTFLVEILFSNSLCHNSPHISINVQAVNTFTFSTLAPLNEYFYPKSRKSGHGTSAHVSKGVFSKAGERPSLTYRNTCRGTRDRYRRLLLCLSTSLFCTFRCGNEFQELKPPRASCSGTSRRPLNRE